MKTLLVILIAIALGVLFVQLAVHDPGYVLVTFKPWSVELSLLTFIALLGLSFAALYVVIRTLVRLWHAPQNLHEWRQRQLHDRARRSQNEGLLQLAQGNWRKAEKQLLSYIAYVDNPVLNYLGAAHSAHHRNDSAQCDHYLAQALEVAPEQTIAIGLTRAQFQSEVGQLEAALATLNPLRARAPRNAKALGLLVQVCRQLGDWDGVALAVREARRHRALPAAELDSLERGATREQVRVAANAEQLQGAWQALSRELKDDSEMIAAYVERLLELDLTTHAESVLHKAVDRHWRPELVRLYGHVRTKDPVRQLKVAEQWALQHPNNPELMLTLAQLSLDNKLWGKARAYLEACIANGGSVEAYRELGHLLEQLDDPNSALGYYRKGLDQAAPEPAPPSKTTAAR